VGVLIRIALRNLREHTSKSVIIGSLIALGVIIIVVGNSLIDTTERGVHGMFIENYTGDVFVSGVAKNPGSSVSLFGLTGGMPAENESTPLLPEADAITARLAADPRVKDVAGQVTGMGLLALGEKDERKMSFLFGVDPATYPALFPAAKLVEGRYLAPGENGLVASKGWLASAEKELKAPVKVGDTLVVNGFGRAGFKIREVTLVGVVDFSAESEGMDMVAWANANTVRILSGVNVSAEDVVLTSEQTSLLNAASEEDIFGQSESRTDAAASRTAAAAASAPAASAAPAEPAAPPAAASDNGTWHFLLVRLADSRQAARFIEETNAWFRAQDIPARAGDWKAAAGPFSQSIDVVRVVFNIAILIVAIVAVIIIMNTLVISVIERTGEIGTMRALGARKPFVWAMFLVETLTITLVFGVIGFCLAAGVVGIVNLVRIPASNFFTQILFGGKVLRMAVKPLSLLTTLLMVAGVGLVSHLYPVIIALKIPPVRAMQAE
jgi:putative ABC transport system permease protein